jgi:GTPase SAR1 family protein
MLKNPKKNLMNVAVVGCAGVGRSSLVARLLAECPPSADCPPTNSGDKNSWTAVFHAAHMPAHETHLVVCDVQQRMLFGFFAHASEGVLVVYDVTSLRSFEEVCVCVCCVC